MIFEYMLIREGGKTLTPYWVEDGGVFYDPDNHTMVGWSPDFGKRVYYVPDSVVLLDKAEHVARALDIHARSPFVNLDGSQMSEAQATAFAESWYDAHTE